MPWFKCSHCRIRRSGLDVAFSATQDTCPLCGRKLDAERDLRSLVGFGFLTNDGSPATTGAPLSLPGGTSPATEADVAFDGLAAERWFDEGGSDGSRSRSP